MRAVVDLSQARSVHVAVHLRGGERAVAEQLLDRAQVGAALEQMRRERVAQAVRVWKQPPERARVEPTPARGEEKRVHRAARQLRPRVAEVDRPAVGGLLAQRHDPLLVALAPDAEELLLEVDVDQVEVDGLLRAQAGGVDELHERAVPDGERPVARERLELAVDLLGPQRVRKATRPTRREGRVGHTLGAERVTQEGPYRSELAADRRRGKPPRSASQFRRVVGEAADVDVLEPRSALPQPGAELLDVDAIGATRGVR